MSKISNQKFKDAFKNFLYIFSDVNKHHLKVHRAFQPVTDSRLTSGCLCGVPIIRTGYSGGGVSVLRPADPPFVCALGGDIEEELVVTELWPDDVLAPVIAGEAQVIAGEISEQYRKNIDWSNFDA